MKFDIQEIKDYINDNPDAKIIIGGDSQKISKKKLKKKPGYKNQKWVRFVTTVIVYQKDKNKIFFEVSKERDIDTNPSKPITRMMNETYKIVDITLKLMDVLIDRNFEIHLDINPDENEGSYCALNQAVGYCWGMIGVEPIVKPDAFVASTVSDHIVKHNKDVLSYY
jgi:predicted RNase H-related nuclease YkuK (DUF458 family)